MANTSEQPAGLSNYPQGGTFGQLLEWHLAWGTYPGCNVEKRNQPWGKANFAAEVHGAGATAKTAQRNLQNWINRGKLPGLDQPDRIDNIFLKLFSDDRNLGHWRRDLEQALERDRQKQAARIAKREIIEPRGIPRPTAHFMGRDDERDILAAMLVSPERPRAVLVQGGPGIGKTELTKAIAHHSDVETRFAERRFFVPLETAATAKAMQGAIISAIGSDPAQGFHAALQTLHGRDTLLVLDNLETPWAPHDQQQETEQVLAVLGSIPCVSLLASFRGHDAVGGIIWDRRPVYPLPPEISLTLFASIAGKRVRDDPHLNDFISELGGIPLAIDLVARRAGRTNLTPLWREWKKIGPKLAERHGFDPDRLTSLTYSFELSLSPLRLPDESREHPALRLFRFLGALPVGLNREDVEVLMGDDAFNAIDHLCDFGIATEIDDRIDLLPPVRQFAAIDYPPGADDSKRWVAHFLEVPRQCARSVRDNKGNEAVTRLRQELPNVEEAFRVDLIQTGGAIARYSLKALARVSQFGHIATSIFEEFLPTRRSPDPFAGDEVGEAYCLSALAWIEAKQGNLDEAQKNYEAALAVWKDIRLPEEEAPIFASLADIALRRSEMNKARAMFMDSLERYIAIEDELGEARCYIGLGKIDVLLRRYGQATLSFEIARNIYIKCDNLLGSAESAFQLGDVAILEARFEDAEGLYEESLTLFKSAGNLLGEANSLRQMARIDLECLDFEIAKERYEQAQNIYRLIKDEAGQAFCQRGIDYALEFIEGKPENTTAFDERPFNAP